MTMLRDIPERLDTAEWFLAAITVGLVALALSEAHAWWVGTQTEYNPLVGVVILGFLAALLCKAIYDQAQPEYDTTCAVCGEEIVVDSATDGLDYAIDVRATESPDRWSLGPLSGITFREKETETVCSGECADAWLEEYERFKWVAGREEGAVSSGADAEVSD